jgi:signal transduction histidine kinase
MFELLAYPLVAMRLTLATAAGGALEAGAAEVQTTRRAASLSVRELVDLLVTEDAANLPGAIATWLCSALDADVAFVVAPTEAKDGVLFIAGYDRTQAKTLPSFTVPAEAAGQLPFALEGRQPLRLDQTDSQPLLDVIASSAGFSRAGTGLFAPMGISETLTLGALLVSPYRTGEWSAEDGELLGMLVQAGTAAFQRLHAIEILESRLQTSEQQTSQALTEGEHLQEEILSLEMQLQQARDEWQKERQRAEGLAVLIKDQDFQPGREAAAPEQGSSFERRIAEATAHEKSTITRLEEELESTRVELSNALQDSRKLPDAIAAAASFRDESLRLQEQLRAVQGEVPGPGASPAAGEDLNRLQARLAETESQARKEIERLQGELRRTLSEYTHLQSALLQPPPQPEGGISTGSESGADTTMVSSLISEIRQPLSSMVGYADLLLSESAGILGAMQRKFLERIRASITRTEALFEDLLQVILLTGKVSAPRIQPVDVATLIDSAISSVSDAIREKNLVLRLDLDEEMPPVEMDRDALQQIINHLVQNAVLATLPEKEVVLTAHAPLSDRESRRALLLTMKDNGPGIAAEDQPRVFTRLYRAEGPLIDGLGDSGVGMAVARTLTESLGGRIWLESQPGAGTTFFVLLPVQPGGLSA